MDVAALLARWNALPAKVRTIAGIAVAGIFVVTLIAGVLTHPSRAAVFASPLHPEQLSEVEERLASWNIAFAPTADNVLVDEKRRNECCCVFRSRAFRMRTSTARRTYLANSAR